MKKYLLLLLCVIFFSSVLDVSAADSLIPPENNEIVSQLGYGDVVQVKHDNTIAEIMEKEKEFSHTGFERGRDTRIETEPSYTAPYSAGTINSEDKQDSLRALKMVRYLAGLPYENVVLDDYETNTAQHKAVLMAVSGYGHHPAKPEDMDDEFYSTANDYSAECIYAGVSNISYSILGFVADPGVNNIARAGHRMILFNPACTQFGIGYAYNPDAQWSDLIAVHTNYGYSETDSYTAWPNSGDFPIQYFTTSTYQNYEAPYPWSLSLGAPYKTPDKEKITLTLTRKRDNHVWVLDKNTPNLGVEYGLSDEYTHLAVNGKNIIFRPDVVSLGAIQDGDVFTVNLSGIEYTDGTPAQLNYEIRFFDLEKEKNNSTITITAVHDGEALPGAEVELDGEKVITDQYGEAKFRVKNNSTYKYVISKNGYNTENGSIKVEESDVAENINMVKTMEIQIKDPVLSQVFNMNITNNSDEKKDITVYTALYDGQDVLMKVIVNNESIPAKSDIETLVSLPNDDYNSSEKIYVFAWEGMIPLFEKQMLK